MQRPFLQFIHILLDPEPKKTHTGEGHFTTDNHALLCADVARVSYANAEGVREFEKARRTRPPKFEKGT